jgi:hypothetical protein
MEDAAPYEGELSDTGRGGVSVDGQLCMQELRSSSSISTVSASGWRSQGRKQGLVTMLVWFELEC